MEKQQLYAETKISIVNVLTEKIKNSTGEEKEKFIRCLDNFWNVANNK
jgi:hypothetical protein